MRSGTSSAIRAGVPLLDPDQPPPFVLENAAGQSSWPLTCKHGGRRLPRRLGDLGPLPAPVAAALCDAYSRVC